MQARFLLGPAGSGKTFRCLAEIRAALKKSPEGPPIIFLAPKQATYQLERQLLADDVLQGFSRLQILSFERLARFIFTKTGVTPPDQLGDEGRLMVLRALLLRHERELRLFGPSSRRPGFARQLGQMLRELQQHQFTPARLRSLAEQKNIRTELCLKLADLALLLESYNGWLAEKQLQDANCLLDIAAEALRAEARGQRSEVGSPSARRPPPSAFRLSGLWLDGFAEMTPQELDLLAALVPFCEHSTLAFCLDGSVADRPEGSWLSIWNTVGKTFQQCRQRLEKIPDCRTVVEILGRDSQNNRFTKSPVLSRLESCWAAPVMHPASRVPDPGSAVRITACANPEAEAVFAAREILKFVRAGNRFRDCGVIVRDLGQYHKPLARSFRRYGIPFFLDRRESIAHHPVAELTRSAARVAAFEWLHDDWFAALKAGFCPVAETDIDHLENAAMEFGWRGKKWREPLPDAEFERLRKKVLPPFETFHAELAKLRFQPQGTQLADLFRQLWLDLRVEQRLQEWSDEDHLAFHPAVFEQMNLWLENLRLGFGAQALPLRDWLPILEAGLANLTVGVVPPLLDEVLVGAIDRARNPDLKFALVLGVNESVFPAAPSAPPILTESDRDELAIPLGPDLRDRLSGERFYGYLACTRAAERLAVTFSQFDIEGNALNPSLFVDHLQSIFPALEIEEFKNEIGPEEVENANELAPWLVQIGGSERQFAHFENQGPVASAPAISELLDISSVAALREALGRLREPGPDENLSAPLAERLYSPVLRTSVSRLEEFAACPFRFFVRSGLRAEERKVFELDARERGSFQHDVLKQFHEQLLAEGKRWRDITPAEARQRIGAIAAEIAANYRSGLLQETAQSRFAARALTASLQDFIAVTIGWLRAQNDFDPVAAELDFGSDESPGTGWMIALENGHRLALRGRIDRVDLHREPDGTALALVVDYKAGGKKLDAVFVEHGIQLQLLAYLEVLRHWQGPEKVFGAKQLVPAGVFYVNLRGQFESGDTRDDVLADAENSQRAAYRYTGRFDADVLKKLDREGAADQFNYRLTNAGKLFANSVEALPRAEFQGLLHRVEQQLTDFGNAIFAGAADVRPYRKGAQTPCEYCDYSAVCRIDPWTHPFRVLK